MKYFYILSFALIFSLSLQAQQVVNSTLMHDGIERSYRVYVPAIYDGSQEVPLVFNFHGFGSNANEQMFYGDFRSLSDEQGFLICHPQGTEIAGQTHFNVGGFTTGSSADDVGFTNAMIDQIAIDYMINQDRIYSTGMSNGGYMSFLLACQLSDRIAAVASVTGSMTPQTSMDCNPSHDMPIMQIHGTTDATVPYEGDPLWTDAIEDVMAYWVGFNGCDPEASIEPLEDINTSDGSTVEHFVYSNCSNPDIVNEHYKITGGGHTWPGTALAFGSTNKDFNASDEIWRFFSQYDINGKIPLSNVEVVDQPTIKISPNPVSDILTIVSADVEQYYSIVSPSGILFDSGLMSSRINQIDVSMYPSGLYFLTVGSQTNRIFKF